MQLVQQTPVTEDQGQQQGTTTTLEELQQALASGQAILQTDPNGGDQLLQMGEGQCEFEINRNFVILVVTLQSSKILVV